MWYDAMRCSYKKNEKKTFLIKLKLAINVKALANSLTRKVTKHTHTHTHKTGTICSFPSPAKGKFYVIPCMCVCPSLALCLSPFLSFCSPCLSPFPLSLPLPFPSRGAFDGDTFFKI